MARPEMQELDEAVESFVALVQEPGSREPVPDSWSVHDTLCHLVHWHEHYVGLVEAGLAGRSPALPSGKFSDLNDAAVRRLHDVSDLELVRRFRRAELDLQRLGRRPGAPQLSIAIKSGAKAWPWPELAHRVSSHIRGHETQLRRQRRRSASAALSNSN